MVEKLKDEAMAATATAVIATVEEPAKVTETPPDPEQIKFEVSRGEQFT